MKSSPAREPWGYLFGMATFFFLGGLSSVAVCATPTLQWSDIYNGTANGSDDADGVAVDSNGDIIAVGHSSDFQDFILIRKFNAAGTLLWQQKYSPLAGSLLRPQGVAVDATGNIFIVAGYRDIGPFGASDMLIVKVPPNGISPSIWALYDGGNTEDIPYGIAVDPLGNVVIAGTWNSPTSVDWSVSYYNSGGIRQWTRVYDGANDVDAALDVTMDGLGNPVAAGYTIVGGLRRWRVEKYDKLTGAVVWAVTYDPIVGHAGAQAGAVLVDPSGMIYVGGDVSAAPGVSTDWHIAKFDPSAGVVPLWSTTLNISGDDSILAGTLLPSGDLVFGGYASFGPRTWTIQGFDPTTGASLGWSVPFGSQGNDLIYGMASDQSCNIYLAGQVGPAAFVTDWQVQKYAFPSPCNLPPPPPGCVGQSPGGDWPQWGHDAQKTFSQGCLTGLVPPLELLWTNSVTHGESPVVINGISYWLEDPVSPTPRVPGLVVPFKDLVARNAATGAISWRQAGAIYPAFTAAGEGQIVVSRATAAGIGGGIRSYDLATGAQVHFFNPLIGNPTAGNVGLVSVDSSTLFLSGGTPGSLPMFQSAAYSLISGAKLWESPLQSSGPIVVGGGLAYYVTSTSVAALNAASGAPVWSRPMSPLPTRVAYDGGSLFCMISGGRLGATVALNAATGSWTWSVTGLDVDTLENGKIIGSSLLTKQPLPAGAPAVLSGNCIEGARTVNFDGDFAVPSQFSQATGAQLSSFASERRHAQPAEGLPFSTGGASGFGFAYRWALATSDAVNGWIVGTEELATGAIPWAPIQHHPNFSRLGNYPRSMALAGDKLFVAGGYTYGPRSVDPPTNLNAVVGYDKVDLTWTPPAISASPVVRYDIFRLSEDHSEGEGPNSALARVYNLEGFLWHEKQGNPRIRFAGSSIGAAYTDTGVTTGIGYYYAVRAITAAGKTSWYSNEVLAVPPGLHAALRINLNGPYAFSGLACADPGGTLAGWDLSYTTNGVTFTPLMSGTNPVGLSANCTFGTRPRSAFPSNAIVLVRLRVTDTSGDHRDAFGPIYNFPNGPARARFLATFTPPWWFSVLYYSDHLHPEGIALDPRGYVYAVDTGKHRVVRLDALAHPLSIIGEPVQGRASAGDLVEPVALAADTDGHLYVADRKRDQVVVYDEDGQFLSAFGNAGPASQNLDKPSGVALSAEGDVWVVDGGHDRLVRFTSDGSFIQAVGSRGSGPGQFRDPGQVTVDSGGQLWIADSGNNRVQVLDASGAAQSVLTGEDTPAGRLQRPTGVAISLASEPPSVYVAEPDRDRVLHFTLDGSLLEEIGASGSGEGEYRKPSALAIDETGVHLYVADTQNNRGQRTIGVPADPVDTLVPRAVLEDPGITATLFAGDTIRIRGRATDAYFKSYRLEVSGPGGTSVIQESLSPVWEGPLAVWNTTGLAPGFYTLTLTVADQIGNSSQDSFQIMLGAPVALAAGHDGLIQELSLPTSELVEGFTSAKLTYRLRRDADVRWGVAESGNNHLVTPLYESRAGAIGARLGANLVWWDGRREDGTNLAPGKYVLVMLAAGHGQTDRRAYPFSIAADHVPDRETLAGGQPAIAGGMSAGGAGSAGAGRSGASAAPGFSGSGSVVSGSGGLTDPTKSNNGVRDHGQGEGRDGHGQGNGRGFPHAGGNH